MKAKASIKERIVRAGDTAKNTVSPQPLVELAGNRRVLIEHHCGITEYGTEKITVKVKSGSICIVGSNLSLMYMSDEKIVITGIVYEIRLDERRCC